MTNLGSEKLSEGWVVLGAGLLMTVVVAGSLMWHAGSRSAAAGKGGARDGAAAIGGPTRTEAGEKPGLGTEARELRETLSKLELKLAEAETELAFVRDSWERSKDRVIEVQAKAELDIEQERNRWVQLEQENRRLQLEIETLQIRGRGLEDQVAVLSEAASGVVSGQERDPSEPVSDVAPSPEDPVDGEAWSGRIRIRDANESLRYVVLTAGKDGQVQRGMLFTVLDGDLPIADLRADDVREGFTGAVVERVYPGGRFPQPDDRVVMRKRIP
jgi:hypothetical protein